MTIEEWTLFHPWLPEPALKPGTGFTTPECGKWIRTAGCEDRTHPVTVIRHSCKTVGCPKCWSDYVADKARDVEERFGHYEQAKLRENARLLPGEMRGVMPRHFVFTISPAKRDQLIQKTLAKTGGWFNEVLFLDILRQEFDECRMASGLLGGLTVYHDCRVRHPETGATGDNAKLLVGREAKLAGKMLPDDPDWKIYEYINSLPNWKEYYYFSPHLHVIAYGKIIDKNDFDDQFPGWTYHNKGDVTSVGGLAYYLFTHMAVMPGRRGITQWGVEIPAIPGRKGYSWWGRMSSRTLGKDLEKEAWEPVLCKCCGKPLVIRDAEDPMCIGQVLTKKVKYWKGFFRADRERDDAAGPPPGGPHGK